MKQRKIKEVHLWGIIPVKYGNSHRSRFGEYRVSGFLGFILGLFGMDDKVKIYRGCYGYFHTIYDVYIKRMGI
jgi:hypothetical protein